MFPSEVGKPISSNNFRKRKLQPAAAKVAEAAARGPEFLKGVTFQSLRRSCATHMQHEGSVKDIQAHLRHETPNVTASIYMQEIPASVRAAVEALDRKLRDASDSKKSDQSMPN